MHGFRTIVVRNPYKYTDSGDVDSCECKFGGKSLPRLGCVCISYNYCTKPYICEFFKKFYCRLRTDFAKTILSSASLWQGFRVRPPVNACAWHCNIR